MSTVSWEETKQRIYEKRRAAGLPMPTPQEDQAAVDKLRAEVRAWQLAEIRRNQELTQRDVAGTMGVSGPRVSAIENGDIDRTEVATLRSYAESIGGTLRIVVDFGDTGYRIA